MSRAATVVARLLVAAAVVAPFWFWNGGLLEYEATEFIRQYLAGRGVIETIFDPYANDLDTYQARELSYALDYVDAHVFKQLISRGYVLFVPFSALAASVLTVLVYFRSVRRYASVPPLTAALVMLLFASNYVWLVTYGMFYRSSKPMLAPVLMATSFYVLGLLGAGAAPASRPQGRVAPAVVFTLLCVMSLLDRQGFFYALITTAVLATAAVMRHVPWRVPVAAAAAVLAMTLYNVVLAPAIVSATNGYVPSLEYQRLPLERFAEPVHFLRGAELLAEGAGLLMGGVPEWAAIAVLAVLAALSAMSLAPSPTSIKTPAWTRRQVLGVGVIVVLAHVFMFAAMVIRHPAVYDQYDHRVWYYPLPFQAILVAVAVLCIGALAARSRRRTVAAVNLLLVLGIAANVIGWSEHVRRQRQSRWFSIVYTQTFLLKRSLETGLPHSEYDGYGPFYRFCLTVSPPFRAVAERAGR